MPSSPQQPGADGIQVGGSVNSPHSDDANSPTNSANFYSLTSGNSSVLQTDVAVQLDLDDDQEQDEFESQRLQVHQAHELEQIVVEHEMLKEQQEHLEQLQQQHQNLTNDAFDELDALVTTPNDDDNDNVENNDDDDDAMNGMILGLGEATADEQDWQLDSLDHPFTDPSGSLSLSFMNPEEADETVDDIHPEREHSDPDTISAEAGLVSQPVQANAIDNNALSRASLDLSRMSDSPVHFLHPENCPTDSAPVASDATSASPSDSPFSNLSVQQPRNPFMTPAQPADMPSSSVHKFHSYKSGRQSNRQRPVTLKRKIESRDRSGKEHMFHRNEKPEDKQEQQSGANQTQLDANADELMREQQQRRQLNTSQQQRQMQLQRQQLDAARQAVDNAHRSALGTTHMLSSPGLMHKVAVGSVPMCRYCGRIIVSETPNALQNHEQSCHRTRRPAALSPSNRIGKSGFAPLRGSRLQEPRGASENPYFDLYQGGLSKGDSEPRLESDMRNFRRGANDVANLRSPPLDGNAMDRVKARDADFHRVPARDSRSEDAVTGSVTSPVTAPDQGTSSMPASSLGTNSTRRDSNLLHVVRRLVRTIGTLDVPARLCLRDALLSLSHKAANPSLQPTPEQEAMNRAAEYLVLRMLFLTGQQVLHTAPGTIQSNPIGSRQDNLASVNSNTSSNDGFLNFASAGTYVAAAPGLPSSSPLLPATDNGGSSDTKSTSNYGLADSPMSLGAETGLRPGPSTGSRVCSSGSTSLARQLTSPSSMGPTPRAPSGLSPGAKKRTKAPEKLRADSKVQAVDVSSSSVEKKATRDNRGPK